ncbi:MAG: hypothetical protein L6420_08770, partial [Elusimicrobia bacterium]|nr:hypothetical protein [Elusimicrobiota bacterium]
MKFSIIILCSCFFLPLVSEAQVSLGAQLAPDGFIGGAKEENIINSADAFADAFVLELSSTASCDVFKSTEPEKEIKKYIRKGFYRQEMIMLFFMARESSSTFKSIADDIEKGKTLEYAAAKNKVSLIEIFKKSEKIKKEIEKRMTVNSAAVLQRYSATVTTKQNFSAAGKKQQEV